MTAQFKILTEFNPVNQDEKQEFIHDVRLGLSKVHKSLDSKYFYDEKGSELFNQITHHPDYYLTNCELEILDCHKDELAALFKNQQLNLIEFGPGEGIKTRLVIDYFLQKSVTFNYFSIDVSKKYLNHMTDKFNKELPNLEAMALNSDYLNGIKWLSAKTSKRNLLMFLGSSLGNFNAADTRKFLDQLHECLHPGDYVLIGFDLVKEIDILLQAYNDSDGITKAFNLNLLRRINNELGANFNLNSFNHYGTYNVFTKAMESYLVSNKDQLVYINAMKRSFHFKAFEAIHVESSQKYSLSDVTRLARNSGFKVVKNFRDSKHYFLDSLWQV
ncbi:MAG: L-histidine N(alpha)-methyltransferase [Tatlockia sp.]|nr:L-histidine N(alpha)-methyltransferase [Tatlockia sp.]